MTLNKAYIEDLIYGRTSSPFLEPFLWLLSLLYGVVVRIRLGLFRSGLLKQKKLEQCVISVGNLTLGGTGKTPAVMQIAGLLLKRQRRPAVVSRGYGRKDESSITVVSDGNRLLTDTDAGGDEPVLLASKLTNVPVVAGRDRYEAGFYAHEKFGNDTVILDDGFQHIRLHRDLDIVLIDAADPFGRGRLFPAGILREPLAGLRRADVILITGTDHVADLEPLKATLKRHTRARIFTSRHIPADLVDISTGRAKPLTALAGTSVLAVAGIARPEKFVSMLGSQSAQIKERFFYPDHYSYEPSDLARFMKKAAEINAKMIVTTEKDAVRLKKLNPEGIWALRIELQVVENQEWEMVLLNRA